MDYTSFSHGQIVSKIWLCDNIEKYLDDSRIAILGGWYNVLGFMLLTRFYNKIRNITSYDINPNVKPIADKITDAWISDKVKNVIADAALLDFNDYDIIINCSPEHMNTNVWFDNIPNNKLVCIQSSNINIKEAPWLVVNPNISINNMSKKYSCLEFYFKNELPIIYEDWGYKRFMIIGRK